MVPARLRKLGNGGIPWCAGERRLADYDLQPDAVGEKLSMSPNGIIPIAAAAAEGPSAEVIHASVPLLWKAFIGAGTAATTAITWLFIQLGILERKHDKDMLEFKETCGARHEREFSRFTDAATKGDVKIIHEKIDVISENIQDIQNNMQDINNNIVLAMRGRDG